ncbi:MAG TPA: sulfate permease [Ilumatobacter sp.]|nr:sulfate permease [Ilumatobacter sp.]
MNEPAADRTRGAAGPPASRHGRLARFVPITGWAPRYPRGKWRGDVTAGLTVAVMLIPQGMAYASLAGMPPISGLYAAIVGIAVYAVLGTSGSLAVGPVAITSLMTIEGVSRVVEPGDPSYPATVALLALVTGMILVVLGLARLGVLVNLLSHPVISGFTSAAAIVIALSQVKDLLGLDIGRPAGTIATVRALVDNLGGTNAATIVLAAAALTALAAGRRYARRWPTALIVVTLATLMAWLFELGEHGVTVLGDVPSGFPSPTLPEMSTGLLTGLVPVAATIAVVAFAEGVSVATAIARKTRDTIDANQELIAAGAANAAAGVFSGFPIAGGFSRTAVNHEAGARTPLASLVTAAVLMVAVLWMTPLFVHLPKAVLAAIVVVAVLTLVDVTDARHTFAVSRADGATLALTFLVTLLVGIEPGLVAGVGFSLAAFVWRNATPHTTELGRVAGTTEYRNVNRWPTHTTPEAVVVRTDGPLFFANSRRLGDHVQRLVASRAGVRSVVLDASAITDIDATGIHALADLDRDLATAGVTLHLATVRGPVRDSLRRGGTWDDLADRVHPSLAAACTAIAPESVLCGPRPGESTVDTRVV